MDENEQTTYKSFQQFIDDPTIEHKLINQSQNANFNLVNSDNKVEISKVTRIMHSWKRWVFLFCLVFANFGSYACYDSPQMLESAIKAQLRINNQKYSLLYQVYSIPNMILPFIAGFLMDKFGIRLISLSSAALIMLGQLVFMTGSAALSLDAMIVGRFLFGFGGENLFVGAVFWIAKWFKGKDLLLAMGINTFMSFLGNSYNSYFTPIIFEKQGGRLWAPLIVGWAFTFLGLLTVSLACYIDYQADQQRHQSEIKAPCQDTTLDSIKILSKNALFWLLLFNIYISSQNFFGLTNYLNDFLMARFGFTFAISGRVLSLMYIIIAVIAPFAGYLVDRYGHQAILMIICNVSFLVAHILFGFMPQSQSKSEQDYWSLVPVCLLGITMSVWETLVWTAIPKVVDKRVVGASIGLCDVSQNVGFFVQPFLYGYVIDNTKDYKFGYFWLSVCFMVTSILGAICSATIFIIDKKKDKKL